MLRTSIRRAAGAKLMAAGLIALFVILPACERKKTYAQSTPDQVVSSAVEMVKDGNATQLPSLVHAENADMRVALDKLGVLLGNLQKLSQATAKRWPQDYAALQQQAVDEAKEKGVGMLNSLASGRNRRRDAGDPDELRSAFNAVLADPYGWIERNSARLSTMRLSDDTASVMLDNQPLIPVIGLPMKLEGDKWFVVLPNNMPPVNRVWPRTKVQWGILHSMLTTMDNAVRAVHRDVEQGKVGSVKELVDSFQKKAMFPLLIASVPYGREIDVSSRIDRRVSQMKTRQKAWVESRRDRNEPVSPKVVSAIEAAAQEPIEAAVRAGTPLAFDKMSDAEFEERIESWLAAAGLPLRASEPLEGEAVEKRIAAWKAERSKLALTAKKP